MNSGRQRWARQLVIGAMAMAMAGPAAAESVGSPAGVAKRGQWLMGLSAESSLSRQLDNGADAHFYGFGHWRGYGLRDWLTASLLLGGAHLTVDDPTILTSDLATDHSFGGSVFTGGQLKAKLLELNNWQLGAGLRYTDARGRRKNKNQAQWHNWQLAGTVSHNFGRVTPYAGGMLSLLSIKYRVRENGVLLKQSTYHQDTPVGLFVGTNVYFGSGEDVVLTVEGAYLDGPEVSTSIAYIF